LTTSSRALDTAGPNDHDGSEAAAYQNACSCSLIAVPSGSAPPGNLVRTDTGQVFDWASIDSQLQGANYPGPYDHAGAEMQAYDNACQCTLLLVGNAVPNLCSSGLYMTHDGPLTVSQMRDKLRVAGYPNWQWASQEEIISVFGRTSGVPVNGCVNSQPPPTTTTPPPVPCGGGNFCSVSFPIGDPQTCVSDGGQWTTITLLGGTQVSSCAPQPTAGPSPPPPPDDLYSVPDGTNRVCMRPDSNSPFTIWQDYWVARRSTGQIVDDYWKDTGVPC